MKKIFKKILFVGLFIFLLMQLYQPARNKNLEQVDNSTFTNIFQTPKIVAIILRTSCYDCHSNNTYYPLYSYLQPIRFFMDNHINEGKQNLNFDEFGNYSKRKQNSKLDRIIKQINSNEMPLSSYSLIHKNAILNAAQKKLVINWVNKIQLKNEELF